MVVTAPESRTQKKTPFCIILVFLITLDPNTFLLSSVSTILWEETLCFYIGLIKSPLTDTNDCSSAV